MMRARLSRRDRRALALGGGIVALALLWTYAVAPYLRALEDVRARLEVARGLLERELELAASAPAIAAEVERAAERLRDVAPRLLPGTGDGVADAALADYVRRHAREARVHLASVAPAGAGGGDAERDTGAGIRLEETTLLVTGEGDLEGLLTLLARLEAGVKLVRVEGLSIDAGQAAPQPGGALPLSFRFTVTGWALPNAGASDSGAEGDA
ncbi:MAG TPA: type II secretion system protein GspM [Longimicrobiales bacterium]